MSKRNLMEKRLWDYGQWSGRVTEAGNYGNSPSVKIEEIGRTGLNSHGTAYLDRSSETMMIPERHQAIDACVHMMPSKYVRIFNAAFVYFIDKRTPKERHKFMRANYADLSLEAYIEVKDDLITSIMQIEEFLFGAKT